MTMPPEERRSPASVSVSHKMRSCSILMGVLSVTDDLADDTQQDEHANGAADDLDAREFLQGTHQVFLDLRVVLDDENGELHGSSIGK